MRKRQDQLSFAVENSINIQQVLLLDLLKKAAKTKFGEKHDFKNITSAKEFKERIPIGDYDSFKPSIKRIMLGEQNILWPTEIKWFAKSSGTTSDKSKFIPVSFEALEECHFRGGRDILSFYCSHFPNTKIFEGKGLLIGGSHEVNRFSENSYYGDLSAVMIDNMPFWTTFLSTPKQQIALMANWEEKIERMAEATMNEDVRSISGVPTWTIVLIKRMIEIKGTKNLLDIWPNLELFIHGGVSFKPYREQFMKLIPSKKMNYIESYNASEGFFAIQNDPEKDDLLLMMDYGIYYEFIPQAEYGRDFQRALGLDEVETGRQYVLVITTNAGLWRYVPGDTIMFTSVNPFKIKITGRTKSFINAFGEEVIVDNSDFAITEACNVTGAKVREYTAAPVFLTSEEKGGHEWLIEFETHPKDMDIFNRILDRTLMSVNSDYEAKRAGNMALLPPKVHVCPENTFYDWLKNKGKLGGQHKVPRLCNDRKILEEILTMNAQV
jgi:hypothetical protein